MNQSRRIFIFCSCFILLLFSPFLAVLGLNAYSRIDEWLYRQSSEFSPARWKKPDLKYRYSALQEVIDHQIRPGMSAIDVTTRLGEPDSFADGGWQYEARRPGWHFIDWQGGGLVIRFTENKVVIAERNHWTD